MRSRYAAGVLALGTVLFGVAIAGRHRIDPWVSNSVAAAMAIAGSSFGLRATLPRLFELRWRSAMLAVALGVGLVVATHLGFRIAISYWPWLEPMVTSLYQDIRTTNPGNAVVVPLIVVIVTAEELLWRGVAVELCAAHLSVGWTAAGSVGLYALPQLIGGSWLLVVSALGLGLIFTLQRLRTGRLTEALITHGIWSVSIFGLVPLV